MGRLVVVYGMDSELEEGLDRLRAAGLGDAARVVQGPAGGAGEAAAEERASTRGSPAADVVVPPAATLGVGGPTGSAAAYAVPSVAAEAERAGAEGWTLGDVERLTGARGDEARHLQRVVAGGGSLLVVEGDGRVLDGAEAALAGHLGQGSVRH